MSLSFGTNHLRPLAGLLLGSTFAILGWEAAREAGPRVEIAARTLDAMRTVLPLPDDNEVIVRANGAVQAAAGAMLAIGVLPRPAAALLVASMVPTTIAGHDFWNVEDAAMRKMQRIQFQKNLAMLGGLLFVLGDANGRWL
jgi:uncharacterized membrane protein YphA (DoxX/SURF4 family)